MGRADARERTPNDHGFGWVSFVRPTSPFAAGGRDSVNSLLTAHSLISNPVSLTFFSQVFIHQGNLETAFVRHWSVGLTL